MWNRLGRRWKKSSADIHRVWGVSARRSGGKL